MVSTKRSMTSPTLGKDTIKTEIVYYISTNVLFSKFQSETYLITNIFR